ncbi:MAG: LysR substrate-binding domain-containing protein [Granulosicoccus sp.]
MRTLVAIADTGNFSAAAGVVFRTPSAVSMQVKKAEEVLGRPLFKRDSRSVMATPDGERLVQHGRRMLALNRELMATFVSPDVAGVVRLGAPDDMIEQTLPALLCRFAQTHCAITVDVVVDSSSNLRQKVRAGELDLAMVTCAPNSAPDKDTEILYEEPLTWAGARHGIAHEQNPLPISVWEEGCAWRNAGLKSLTECKRDYRIAFMSAHIAGQRAAIMADLAVAPIPVSACINGIVALGEKQGLPSPGYYALGMILSEQISKPAEAAADHLRASVTAKNAPGLNVVGGL